MNVDARHVAYKKKVGKVGENPVFEICTTGGLHMIILGKSGGFETIGTGSHRAVARHIAQKREPSISWSDLLKADHVPAEAIEPLLPKYEALTDDFRRVSK